MPSDLRKISWLAVALVVILRISIGWHLFYEGVWKLKTQKSATPWTAEGYLKNATGPLRTTFRNMTGDPNDLKWLDYDAMSTKWDAWRDRFVTHYQLDESQANKLALLLDGPANGFSVAVGEMPPGFDFDEVVKSAGVAKGALKYDAGSKKLVVDGKLHLLQLEQAKLIEELKKAKAKASGTVESDSPAAADTGNDASTAADEQPATEVTPTKDNSPGPFDKLIDAIKSIGKQSSKLSFRERLAGIVKGDPDRVGMPPKDKREKDDLVVTVGEVEFYNKLIDRYESNLATPDAKVKTKTKFQWDHLERQWNDLQSKRRTLVGPVQSLEKELFEEASKLLSANQFSRGAVPEPSTEISQINLRTMWGLTIFGLFLIAGFFTRISALGGAALLSLFYLAMPPWPGVQEIPSIEHNLIVNKIFVEFVALLAVASMPSGQWFGVDALFTGLRMLRQNKQADK